MCALNGIRGKPPGKLYFKLFFSFERVKIFLQKNFALKSRTGAGGAPGDTPESEDEDEEEEEEQQQRERR